MANYTVINVYSPCFVAFFCPGASISFAAFSRSSIFFPGSANSTLESIVVSSAIFSIAWLLTKAYIATAVSTMHAANVTCPAHGYTGANFRYATTTLPAKLANPHTPAMPNPGNRNISATISTTPNTTSNTVNKIYIRFSN